MEQSRHFVEQIVKKVYPPQTGALNESQEEQEAQVENKFKIKRVSKRSFNDLKLSTTLNPFHHVYIFFKAFSINLNALRVEDFEENLFRSWFYHKDVTKVEKYHNAVVICAIPSADVPPQPDQKHFLPKLMGFQKAQTTNLVTILQEILQFISKQKTHKRAESLEAQSYSITKILNSFKDTMFICKLGLFKFAISNSLLEHLGIDIDQFCIETIKYRTALFDFLSAKRYPEILGHCFRFLRNVFALSQSKITKSQLQQMKSYKFSDYVYGKNNVNDSLQKMKSYCDMQLTFPKPEILLIRILKVHNKVNELSWKRYGSFESEYFNEKRRLNQKEFQLLYQLENEPEQGRPKNKVARYINKPNLSD